MLIHKMLHCKSVRLLECRLSMFIRCINEKLLLFIEFAVPVISHLGMFSYLIITSIPRDGYCKIRPILQIRKQAQRCLAGLVGRASDS